MNSLILIESVAGYSDPYEAITFKLQAIEPLGGERGVFAWSAAVCAYHKLLLGKTKSTKDSRNILAAPLFRKLDSSFFSKVPLCVTSLASLFLSDRVFLSFFLSF